MNDCLTKKILIIKREHNEFEKFWSIHMRNRNVDVAEPYRTVHGIMHYVRAICKKSKNHFVHGMWIENWKKEISKYDIIIIFDNCATEELLRWINEEAAQKKIVLWIWNVPQKPIASLRKYANIICFDEDYSNKNNLNYIHQFYFEDIYFEPSILKKDFIYVGTDKNRYEILKLLAVYAKRNGLDYIMYLYDPNYIKNSITDEIGIIKSHNMISYSNLLNLIKISKAIVEINLEHQSGLTLRALEALFLGKKLITNNVNIKNFDFYNVNNIYILNDTNSDLKEFLDKPMIPINKEIILKYTYMDWLTKIIKLYG